MTQSESPSNGNNLSASMYGASGNVVTPTLNGNANSVTNSLISNANVNTTINSSNLKNIMPDLLKDLNPTIDLNHLENLSKEELAFFADTH